MPKILKKPLMQHLVIATLFLWISVSIGYWAVTKYDIDDSATSDVRYYIKMSRGESINNIPKPWRYRVVVPYLAGMAPDHVPLAEGIYYTMTDKKRIALQFGIVNVLGMACAAYLLFVFCSTINFTFYESVIAGFFYLTSFYVINFTAVPLVDSWAYATLMAGVLFIRKRLFVIFIPLSLFSVFVKETYFLMLLYSIIIPDDNRDKIKSLFCLVPAVLAYAYFRFILYPADFGVDQSVWAFIPNMSSQIVHGFKRLGVLFIEGGQSFGVMWFFLIIYVLYLRFMNRTVTKMLLVVPFVLAVPFLLRLDFGRPFFLTFPAIIPAAVLAFAKIFENFSASSRVMPNSGANGNLCNLRN